MKKRVAYIGISYPLLYDYMHPAERTANDLQSSPNPIIESPLGLLVLYDEILFLCRSVCPDNMRNLPYVKFVDELYPDFYFGGILEQAEEGRGSVVLNSALSYNDIVASMNIRNWRLDNHTHQLRIGDIETFSNWSEDKFLFDVYVFEALQQRYDQDIELIANSLFQLKPCNGGAEAEFVDKIIIPGIPNYLSTSGPYHECMEELRENQYLKDFRRWIVENHAHLQRAEIHEMCAAVEKNIEEVKSSTFKRYLNDNSGFAFFKSTGSTILKTTLGCLLSPISIADALKGITDKGRTALGAKSVRWQGFVLDAKETLQKNELLR